jgi:hypothetical protein
MRMMRWLGFQIVYDNADNRWVIEKTEDSTSHRRLTLDITLNNSVNSSNMTMPTGALLYKSTKSYPNLNTPDIAGFFDGDEAINRSDDYRSSLS